LRTSLKFILPTVAASVLISACGSSSGGSTGSQSQSAAAGSSASPAALVKTSSSTSLGGSVLTTAQGLTLYRLTGEKSGKFICTSKTCLSFWHPLVPQSGSQPTGTSSLGTVKRPDGTMQVTFKSEPLYTFVKDTKPGQANGQGFKDVGTWFAVMSSSKATSPAPVQSSSSSSRGSAY
jgi:predicted lipoprotein with Yx(FWY)xxD motif